MARQPRDARLEEWADKRRDVRGRGALCLCRSAGDLRFAGSRGYSPLIQFIVLSSHISLHKSPRPHCSGIPIRRRSNPWPATYTIASSHATPVSTALNSLDDVHCIIRALSVVFWECRPEKLHFRCPFTPALHPRLFRPARNQPTEIGEEHYIKGMS